MSVDVSTTPGATNVGSTSSLNASLTAGAIPDIVSKAIAATNQPLETFSTGAGGEAGADSARVANLTPGQTAAFKTIGGMDFASPMNTGISTLTGALQSTWDANKAKAGMDLWRSNVQSNLYDQAAGQLTGLQGVPSINAGLAGTQGVLGSSFLSSGSPYMDQYRAALGTSSMLNQAGQGLASMGAQPYMQSGANLLASAAGSQFGQEQANQYLTPMQAAVGADPGLQQAIAALSAAGGGQALQQGVQNLSTLGGSTFGLEEAKKYMSPYEQQVIEAEKQAAIQDYARTLPGATSAAFKAGAGTGTRAALLQAEGQRNLNTQLANIEAKGMEQAYENAQKQYETDINRQLGAAGQQITAGKDITAAQSQLGTAELARRQQQYDTAARLYGEDIARRMTGGQNLFNVGADIYGKQYTYGADELARNRDAYNAAIAQYNAEQANKLAASGQSYTQGMGILGQQLGAGERDLARQTDAYNQAMAQYNTQTARNIAGAQSLYNMGADIYGRQLTAGEMERAQKQRELDAMYEDFMKAQNYPMEQLKGLTTLLSSMPNYEDIVSTGTGGTVPVDKNAVNLALGNAAVTLLTDPGVQKGIASGIDTVGDWISGGSDAADTSVWDTDSQFTDEGVFPDD